MVPSEPLGSVRLRQAIHDAILAYTMQMSCGLALKPEGSMVTPWHYRESLYYDSSFIPRMPTRHYNGPFLQYAKDLYEGNQTARVGWDEESVWLCKASEVSVEEWAAILYEDELIFDDDEEDEYWLVLYIEDNPHLEWVKPTRKLSQPPRGSRGRSQNARN